MPPDFRIENRLNSRGEDKLTQAKSKFVKRLSVFLAVLMVVAMIPGRVKASGITFEKLYIYKGSIAFTSTQVTYTDLAGKTQTEAADYTHTIYEIAGAGDATSNNISISGCKMTLQLDGVIIDTNASAPPLVIKDHSNVTLALSGENELSVPSISNYAGLEIQGGSTVTISDADYSGTLDARGGETSAAIGIGYDAKDTPGTNTVNISSGTVNTDLPRNSPDNDNMTGIGTCTDDVSASLNINISGGTVNALASGGSASIGQGFNSSVECNITISGGDVTALGNDSAANIGQGYVATGNTTVTITGGTVNADSSSSNNQNPYDDIGNGASGPCKAVYISGGCVAARAIIPTPQVSSSDSRDVYLAEITVPKGKKVQYIHTQQGGVDYSYGSKNMLADSDSNGKLYFWLPANTGNDETTADVTTESGTYTGFHGKISTVNLNVLKVDQAPLTINGMQDNYTVPASIAPSAIGGTTGNTVTYSYSGRNGTDYGPTDTKPAAVGNYTLTATMPGSDTYYDTVATKDFVINPNTSDMKIAAIADQPYTGSKITPELTVTVNGNTLSNNKDYTVSLSNDTDVGTANVVVTGINSYAGYTASATFNIVPSVQSITIGDKTLSAGQSTSLTVTGHYSDGSAKDLTSSATWNSSNTSIAAVDADGKVSAKGEGSATITATVGSISGTSAITVLPAATAVMVTSASGGNTIIAGLGGKDTLQLQATVQPQKALQGVTWSSSDTSVVTVDDSGTVAAVTAGTANITATAADGSGKASTPFPVRVYSVATGVAVISQNGATAMKPGDTLQMNATVSPDTAMQSMTWSSSDETVATVDGNGKVTALKAGTATVTATAADGSGIRGSKTLTVADKPTISVTGDLSGWAASVPLTVRSTTYDSNVSAAVTVSFSADEGKNFGTPQAVTNGRYTATKNGIYRFIVTDGLNQTAARDVTVANIDNTPPNAPAIINAGNYTSSKWYDTPQTVSATFASTLGCTEGLQYSLDDGNTWTCGSSVTVSKEGSTGVSFRVIDALGRTGSVASIPVNIDTAPPTNLTITYQTNPVKTFLNFVTFHNFFNDTVDGTVSARDAQSGVDASAYQYEIVPDGGSLDQYQWVSGDTFSVRPDFKGTVYARAKDKAGNAAEAADLFVSDHTAPSITAYYAYSGQKTYDSGAKIDVKVQDGCAGVNQITYQIGSGAVRTVDATSGGKQMNGNDSFTIDHLPDGDYNVTVGATDNSDNSATSMTLPVSKASVSDVAVNNSPANVKQGSVYGLSASVAGGNIPSQSVAWNVTGNRSAATQIDRNGRLTVGTDETAPNITVTAVSAADSSKSGSVTIPVKERALTGIAIKTSPSKTTYIEGQGLDVTGAAITAVYDNGTTVDIPVTQQMTAGFDSGKTGAQTVTVTYGGKAAGFTVDVLPKKITTGGNGQSANTGKTASADISRASLPSGVASVSLKITELSSQSAAAAAVSSVEQKVNATIAGNTAGVAVYNIELIDQNGNTVEPTGGTVTVRLPVPSGMSGNLHVYWFNPADGTLTDMNAVQENGYLVFETSHFSDYAVAQLKSSTEGTSSGTVPNPKTGSNDWPFFPLALLGGASAAGFAVMKKHVRYRVKKG